MTKFLKNLFYNQFFRYLIVGGWNTVFGVGIYALAVAIFPNVHYLFLAVPVQVLAVTNAYFCYKFFVFKTRGNYLREYIKCFGVYGVGSLLNMVLLYLLVHFFEIHPSLANLMATSVVVLASFLGHRYFSFKKV